MTLTVHSRDRPLTLDEVLHQADMMGADIDHLQHIEKTYCGANPTERN